MLIISKFFAQNKKYNKILNAFLTNEFQRYNETNIIKILTNDKFNIDKKFVLLYLNYLKNTSPIVMNVILKNKKIDIVYNNNKLYKEILKDYPNSPLLPLLEKDKRVQAYLSK